MCVKPFPEFVSSSGFFVGSSGFSSYVWTEVTSPLPLQFGYLFFSCLVALLRNSRAGLHTSGQSGRAGRVSDRGGLSVFPRFTVWCQLWGFH